MSGTIAIIGQGGMGAAVAAELVRGGMQVLAPLAGRSQASRDRAAAAGVRDASAEDIAAADLVLAIVPPAQASAVANSMLDAIRSAGRGTVYVDLNAISPDHARAIAASVAEAGGVFVDGGIIGLPPRPGRQPKFYVSGEQAERVRLIDGMGLSVRVLEDMPVGAASALKLCYAGLTKGLIALGSAQLLAAARAGIADALLAELDQSQASVIAGLRKSIPDMLPKAGRWVAEMQEIASLLGEARPESAFYEAAARFYGALAADGEEGAGRRLLDLVGREQDDG